MLVFLAGCCNCMVMITLIHTSDLCMNKCFHVELIYLLTCDDRDVFVLCTSILLFIQTYIFRLLHARSAFDCLVSSPLTISSFCTQSCFGPDGCCAVSDATSSEEDVDAFSLFTDLSL